MHTLVLPRSHRQTPDQPSPGSAPHQLGQLDAQSAPLSTSSQYIHDWHHKFEGEKETVALIASSGGVVRHAHTNFPGTQGHDRSEML